MSSLLLLMLVLGCVFVVVECAPRSRAKMDFTWKFHLGDITDKSVIQPGYNDASWRTLDIPHDFVVEGTFTPTADKSHGYLPYNVGWYRKHFAVPAASKGQTIWIDFDGTYRDTNTYLNGVFLGNHPSGYTSYRYYLSDSIINYGGDNVLVLRVDCTHPEGWWYDGGGIYRHVWLNIADPLHVEPWGVYAPSNITSSITKGAGGPMASATVSVQTTLKNDYTTSVSGTLLSELMDSTGTTVGKASSPIRLAANTNATTFQSISLATAQLWSLDSPTLYTLVSRVLDQNGSITDVVETTIGIRKIFWDVNHVFFLNDEFVKIKGLANHQDFAGVGVAVPDSLQTFRVSKLKEMGANAWRTAHNPPTSALLDEADRLGFLVWDENHNLTDTAENQEDVRRLVLRDRNHPSIIMWSLCNEALCNGEGSETARRVGQLLKTIILEHDTTRPITAAMNGGYGTGLSYVVDIQGFNYHISLYDSYHSAHPTQPLIGSETASTVSDRGIYANNATTAYVSAYDVNYPSWGATAEDAWKPIAQRDFFTGGFVWAGFDYKGEPTPYGWPNINSHFGVLDIAGFPKDNFWYYQISWTNVRGGLHVYPHWNWQVGEVVQVWAFSNEDSVELFVNGKSQGKLKVPLLDHVSWKVTYEPGNIEGRAYDVNGKLAASQTIRTTGNPASIELSLDLGHQGIVSDGQDVALITGSVVDENGLVVPVATNEIQFSITGPGAIIGVGSGDPSSHEPDKSDKRKVFNGLVRAIVQSVLGQQGEIVVTASSDGLKPAKIVIPVTKPVVVTPTL